MFSGGGYSLKSPYRKLFKGFTLSELLLSLIIVGIIAIITVPVIISNVQKKLFATQVKNFVAQIEQLAQDELITHRTRDLSNTDFADPAKLLSDMHFKIVKSCSSSNSLTDCWKTSGTQKERVNYKSISKIVNNPGAGDSIILKNGLLMRYKVINSATVVGQFLIDINGSDKPNISGRDYFGFGIDHKGQIVFQYCTASLEQLISDCKTKGDSTAYYCYAVLASNNWKMDY